MKDKLFFKNSYINRRTNGANRAYWTKYLKKLLGDSEPLFNKIDTFDKLAPIISFLPSGANRAVIIYQYDPQEVDTYDSFYEHYITAWTKKIKIRNSIISILTIYMVPSAKNNNTAKELIHSWYFCPKKLQGIIDEIYSKHIQYNTPVNTDR